MTAIKPLSSEELDEWAKTFPDESPWAVNMDARLLRRLIHQARQAIPPQGAGSDVENWTPPDIMIQAKFQVRIEELEAALKECCYCEDPAYRSIEPCAACEALKGGSGG